MRHFPSSLPRGTKVGNRNFAPSFMMASTAGKIAYRRKDGGLDGAQGLGWIL